MIGLTTTTSGLEDSTLPRLRTAASADGNPGAGRLCLARQPAHARNIMATFYDNERGSSPKCNIISDSLPWERKGGETVRGRGNHDAMNVGGFGPFAGPDRSIAVFSVASSACCMEWIKTFTNHASFRSQDLSLVFAFQACHRPHASKTQVIRLRLMCTCPL